LSASRFVINEREENEGEKSVAGGSLGEIILAESIGLPGREELMKRHLFIEKSQSALAKRREAYTKYWKVDIG
jgi:hypothetical protein